MFKIIEATPSEDEWIDVKSWDGQVVKRIPLDERGAIPWQANEE